MFLRSDLLNADPSSDDYNAPRIQELINNGTFSIVLVNPPNPDGWVESDWVESGWTKTV